MNPSAKPRRAPALLKNLDTWRRLGAAALVATATLAFASTVHSAGRTYTSDADFALGLLDGVNFNAPNSNQLQLNAVGTTFPVMWIANAGDDTVSKFDTVANVEIARYRTWFGPTGQAGTRGEHGAYSGPAPSRTAVDIQGNAYVLNRFFENKRPVLVKILAEGFIDRNGNGVPDTSSGPVAFNMADTNGNDRIDPAEITDERIAWAVEVGSQNGLGRALCIGTDGNLWVGMYNASTYYKVRASDGSQIAGPVSTTPTAGQPTTGSWTPYGCLIDRNGTLWSASLNSILGKIENTASDSGPYTVSSFRSTSSNYGIALGNDKVYMGQGNQVFNPATNTFTASGITASSLGVVVDGSGNIISGSTTIQKVSPTGTLLWSRPLQSGGSSAVGVQVDSNNDVWQIGFVTAGRMQKYRGSDGTPLGTFPVGRLPYTYSDAAGFSARNVTTPTGTWTVVYDSGANGTPWGTINWNDLVPAGAAVLVSARTAETEASLSSGSYQPVTKNVPFTATGRYIQVQTRFNANLTSQSPVLFDLTLNSNVVAGVCRVDADEDVDVNDIALIRAGIGQTPVPGDPRDADGDGQITMLDVRQCTLQCTRPRCAP